MRCLITDVRIQRSASLRSSDFIFIILIFLGFINVQFLVNDTLVSELSLCHEFPSLST